MHDMRRSNHHSLHSSLSLFLSLFLSHTHYSTATRTGTLDDSVGECFDKAARLLGLRNAGSGGAAIEAAAMTSQDAKDRVGLRRRAKEILRRLDCQEEGEKVVLEGEDKDTMREYVFCSPFFLSSLLVMSLSVSLCLSIAACLHSLTRHGV